jgi:acyl-CoA dehydrogenase
MTMRSEMEGTAAQVSLVFAYTHQLEIKPKGSWNPMGMRATESLPVALVGAVPSWQVVADTEGFREIALQTFAPLAHVFWAACWLGAATGALARTVAYLRTAKARASHDLSSEQLHSRLGHVRCRLELVHGMLGRTIPLVEQDGDLASQRAQIALNALKVVAAEETFGVVNELVELVGLREGYMRGSSLWLERTLRDLRSATLNISNDRLSVATGRLALMDTAARFA